MKKLICIICILITFISSVATLTVFADAVTVSVTPGLSPSATRIDWTDRCYSYYGLLPKQFDISIDGEHIASVSRDIKSYSIVLIPGEHTVTVTATLNSSLSKSASATFIVYGQEYDIYYDSTGGTNMASKQVKTYGIDIQLFNDIPVREGYVFLGWALADDLQTVKYNPGDVYSENVNTTLYAVWEDTYVSMPLIQVSNIVGGKSVTFSCDTINTQIYYTMDLSEPNTSSIVYTDELKLTTEGIYTIKAIATNGKYYSSVSEVEILVPKSPFIMNSGIDANGISWVLDSTGLLTFSGMGQMEDYAGHSPFYENTNIHKVIIGEGITHIGVNTFEECSSLTEIYMPEGLLTIGRFAFNGCSSLDNVILPSTLISLDEGYEFRRCSALNSIVIPDGIQTIGIKTFDLCRKLKEIFIPKTIVKIDLYAFKDCEKLTDVYFNGTEEDWLDIQVRDGSEYLLSAAKHYNYPIYKAKAPVSDTIEGEVVIGTQVKLNSIAEDATIYYTTDGTDPNQNSIKYNGAITIIQDTVIKAIAIKEGFKNSDVVTFTYVVKSSLPVLMDYVVTHKKTSSYYKVYLTFDKPVDNANLQLVLYDSSGNKLSGVCEPCEGDDYYIVTIPVEQGSAEIRTFVWSDKLKPLAYDKTIFLN